MGFLSTIINGLGLILLTHSIYSAHEHTALLTSAAPASETGTAPSSPHELPLDIVIELLASVLLISVGVVLASPSLRPIQWNKWAGEIQKKGAKEENGELTGVNPFAVLEERRGFWDVRAKRKEFADWVRDGSKPSGL